MKASCVDATIKLPQYDKPDTPLAANHDKDARCYDARYTSDATLPAAASAVALYRTS